MNEYQMGKEISGLGSYVLDFALREIAEEVRKALLADGKVSPTVRFYLTSGGFAAFSYYFKNGLGSADIYSGREGRAQLQEFDRLLEEAEKPLLESALSEKDVVVYQTIVLLSHPDYRYQAVGLAGCLVHNYQNGFLLGLCALCHHYHLTQKGQFLEEVLLSAERYISYSEEPEPK
jgi:hypothetical protein